ncbi:BTB-domain-containing protein [Gigaspora margarita]|uniref:BTB-domain-containing protein n=1 Tax=Gigaspora margarita TaxID=4874 RepID=A0A8H4A8D6_GIGMA|nr:BTB-domain-containing protein [Gigaspora margarita]
MDPSTTSHEITSYDNQVSESVNLDSHSNEPLQSLTAIVLPPNFIPTKSQGKKNSATQNQNTNVNTSYKPGGLLNHKYPLHVVPEDLKQNVYKHRLSYNTLFDAYYENGVTDNRYISTWHEGALRYDNIYYKIEHDWEKCYLSRNPNRELDPGEILWRFDYRSGKFTISTLFLKLQHAIFNDEAIVEWSISTLPTKSNANPIYQMIKFESNTYIVDATSFVKGEYGFTLRAHLRGGKSSHISWQWTQLFRCNLKGTFDFFLEEDYGLDVKAELVPDIICDPLPEVKHDVNLNDRITSDFIIYLKTNETDKNEDNSNLQMLKFYVHSSILAARSDYFRALIDSHMIESNERSLVLTDITQNSLEIMLSYIYTGALPNITMYDKWVELLYDASRFLIPTLIQRCEKALRDLLDNDNLEATEGFAKECGANQLLRCCEMFVVENSELIL